MTRRVAAVDCGTNSLRLLLADVDPGRAELTDVARRMEIVRLGQGVDKTGRLAPEALARTIAVLRDYAGIIASSGAQAVRMVATSATRDADNAAEFVRLVKEVLGVAPEVLTGAEEAMLSFTGATAELATEGDGGPFLVADIGGGSTEFVLGEVLARGDDPPQTPPAPGGKPFPPDPLGHRGQARLVVAVDGPSGAGKSSASRGAAIALGLEYLDTGSMYRALTWWLLDQGVDANDAGVVSRLAAEPAIEVGTDPRAPWVRVNGTDVSAAIRSHEVTSAVSAVARVPRVRAHLIAQQRDIIANAPGIVAEGRDIGTVVAPDAPVKVFLTADSTARAGRRAAETSWSPASTRVDQDRRDQLDAGQSAKADDAVEIDSTRLDLDQVIDTIVRLARERADVPPPRQQTR